MKFVTTYMLVFIHDDYLAVGHEFNISGQVVAGEVSREEWFLKHVLRIILIVDCFFLFANCVVEAHSMLSLTIKFGKSF